MAPRSILRPAVVAAVFLAAVAAAEGASQQAAAPIVAPVQAAPTPTPTPPNSPVALATPSLVPRPGIDDVPTPVFVPNPRPTPTRAAPPPAAAPATISTSAPRTMPTPTPRTPSITRPTIETVILPQPQGAPLWPWVVGGAALSIIIAGGLALRHRRDGWDDAGDEEMPDIPSDLAVEASPVGPPAASSARIIGGDRARLTVALYPTRTGLNLISATTECDVTIANIGGAVAEDVRASLRLTSAREDQEAELADFYALDGGRPAVAPFALAPGEKRSFRAVAALPHDAIHSIDAGGRPMFLPLLALSVRYRDRKGPRRIGQAFMVGVDQGAAAKLAPLWLDGPARSYDNVAARPHREAVER